MRLPDPTTVPAGPGFTQTNLVPKYPGMQHVLNSSSVVSIQVGGQYWEISVQYPELLPEQARILHNFLLSLNGAFTPFEIVLPQHSTPLTGIISSPENGVLRASSGSVIVIDQWDTAGGMLSVGDIVSFSNNAKVYMVTASSYIAGGATNGTLTISINFPLLSPVTSVDKIQTNNVEFRVKIDGDVPTFTFTNNGLYSPMTLKVRETIL